MIWRSSQRYMKNMKFVVALLLAVGLLSIAASAQVKSLRNVTDKDVFASEDDGFEISLPEKWAKIEEVPTGTRYSWDVKEGMIAVTIREAAAPRSAAQIDEFLAGYRSSLAGAEGAKLVAEAPAKIGDYRGKVFNLLLDGEKNQFIVLLWGKFSVVLHGAANSKVPESDRLISEALQSFEFVSEN